MRFQRSFPACGYVFKVITLVWVNQRNCFENAIAWKRVSQRSLNKLIFAIKNEPSFYTVFLFPLHPFCHPSFNSFVGPIKLYVSGALKLGVSNLNRGKWIILYNWRMIPMSERKCIQYTVYWISKLKSHFRLKMTLFLSLFWL